MFSFSRHSWECHHPNHIFQRGGGREKPPSPSSQQCFTMVFDSKAHPNRPRFGVGLRCAAAEAHPARRGAPVVAAALTHVQALMVGKMAGKMGWEDRKTKRNEMYLICT